MLPFLQEEPASLLFMTTSVALGLLGSENDLERDTWRAGNDNFHYRTFSRQETLWGGPHRLPRFAGMREQHLGGEGQALVRDFTRRGPSGSWATPPAGARSGTRKLDSSLYRGIVFES